jgi:esterase/lipase
MADVLDEREADSWLEVSGFAVPLWLRGSMENAKRIVILSHGFTNDHRDAPLFGDIRRAFSDDDRTMLIDFDYPGSGSADGEFTDKRLSVLRKTVIAVAQYARKQLPHGESVPISAIGRSLGATILLSVSQQIRPSRLALMSPPYELMQSLGPLQGERSADGYYPLPDWAKPSGQVKGRVALSYDFYEELEPEEARVRDAAASAGNVLLISSTEDPKVQASEMDALWHVLSENPSNSRSIFASDHNYNSVRHEVTDAVVRWVKR